MARVKSEQLTRQDERSGATRRLLLDATVSCLVERGYVGTTSAAVAQQAGLSRGAQLHHFGTRDQMVVAAIEHLTQERLLRVREQMARLTDSEAERDIRGAERAALELLAEALSGPLYAATLELWVAARWHLELRNELVPAEHRVNAELREICRAYVTNDPLMIQLTLDLLLGRGVSGMLVGYPAKRQQQALDEWASVLRARSAP